MTEKKPSLSIGFTLASSLSTVTFLAFSSVMPKLLVSFLPPSISALLTYMEVVNSHRELTASCDLNANLPISTLRSINIPSPKTLNDEILKRVQVNLPIGEQRCKEFRASMALPEAMTGFLYVICWLVVWPDILYGDCNHVRRMYDTERNQYMVGWTCISCLTG